MYPHNPLASVAYHLNYLTLIEVVGEDASQFLQGQLTCNINELTENKASIAAFCNAKGRVISTLIVSKIQTGYLLILPKSLAEAVLKKLQMYVLRSKVKLCLSTDLSLYGVAGTASVATIALPQNSFECSQTQNLMCIKMPSRQARFLFVVDTGSNESASFEDISDKDVAEWRYQDISSGFPWFEDSQTEHYIPQMLNIDQLGGISFNKGCYTGQEIVARTHYLGKSKRQLHLAECNVSLPTDSKLTILDGEKQTKCGDVVIMQVLNQNSRMLIVLQTVDDSPKNLILDNQDRTPIKLIAFQ